LKNGVSQIAAYAWQLLQCQPALLLVALLTALCVVERREGGAWLHE
jgi:hypothetical protein